MDRTTNELLALTRNIAPINVAGFLAAHGWTLKSENPTRQTWALRKASLLLPMDDTFADYTNRLYEAVGAIGLIHHMNVEQLRAALMEPAVTIAAVVERLADVTKLLADGSVSEDDHDAVIRETKRARTALADLEQALHARGWNLPDA